jgi:hypothetical protein
MKRLQRAIYWLGRECVFHRRVSQDATKPTPFRLKHLRRAKKLFKVRKNLIAYLQFLTTLPKKQMSRIHFFPYSDGERI